MGLIPHRLWLGAPLCFRAAPQPWMLFLSSPSFPPSLEGGAAVEVDTYVLAMFDLSSGGADAVLMDEVVANYYIANPAEQE